MEEVMEMAPDLTKAGRTELVKAVARRIAKEAPTLEDLDEEGLEKLAKAVVLETLKDDLKQRAKLEKIDYEAEREAFLSRAHSSHTGRAYTMALAKLSRWCSKQGVSPLELTPALADDWIEAEKAGASPATVRLRVSGASAFFTWLERRHAEIRNPFRGTRSRPGMKATRALAVPSEDEITAMIQEAKAKRDKTTAVAILLMARLGLRVGALPGMSITGDQYMTTTKGKGIHGKISEDLRNAIKRAGLPLREPFNKDEGGKPLSASIIADRIRLVTVRMHNHGKLKAVYSAHDLRHAFAVGLYRHTHDIYAVRVALYHATVTVTENYLRSLGLEA